MRLEYYDGKKLKEELMKIAGKHLDLSQYTLFFFGSRVTGKGDDVSDVDVGIEGSSPIPFDTMRKIREDVEDLKTLYKIEVVDFQNTSDTFRSVAKDAVEYISKPMEKNV